MDVFLEHRVSPQYFFKSVSQQLPRGADISEVLEVGIGLPSLQSQVQFADYEVSIATDRGSAEMEDSIRALLNRDSLPWEHVRDKEVRKYDLRSLIDSIRLVSWQPSLCCLGMRLRCDSKGTGRPEQVAAALGFPEPPTSIHRTGLILGQPGKYAVRRR